MWFKYFNGNFEWWFLAGRRRLHFHAGEKHGISWAGDRGGWGGPGLGWTAIRTCLVGLIVKAARGFDLRSTITLIWTVILSRRWRVASVIADVQYHSPCWSNVNNLEGTFFKKWVEWIGATLDMWAHSVSASHTRIESQWNHAPIQEHDSTQKTAQNNNWQLVFFHYYLELDRNHI